MKSYEGHGLDISLPDPVTILTNLGRAVSYDLSRSFHCMSHVLVDYSAVNEYMSKTFRGYCGILIGSRHPDLFGVEEDDVCIGAFPYDTSVLQTENPLGW